MGYPRWMGGDNNKLRSTVIGSTSQGTHQLILPAALCSRPCVQQSVKRTPTDAEPHAALPAANITSLCLHSCLQILLRSRHRADESAAGVSSLLRKPLHNNAPRASYHLASIENEVLFTCSVLFLYFMYILTLPSLTMTMLQRGAEERHLLRAARDHQRVEEHLPPWSHPRHRGHLPVLPWISAERLWDPHVPVGPNMEWRRTKMWRR